MTIAALTYVSFVLAAGDVAPQECPMHAQHQGTAAAAANAVPAQSPYAGEQSRAIKALSDADIKGYLEGTGMGLARPAELNEYPGPRHVLENADALRLSDSQRAVVEASFQTMRAEAVPLGRQIVETEKQLDALFAQRTADPAAVATLTGQSAELQGRLRAVHLRAHLDVRALLTPEQIQQYVSLRGYGHAGHDVP